MIVLAMVFAAFSGVLQLMLLGSWTRTVRLRMLLLSVGVGIYGCGLAAVALQFAYTRAVAALTDDRIFDVVRTAAYTVDPFIEEMVKVAPLVAAGLVPRIRRQWGLTDYLLLGAALGAGFGLLEAVARFGDEAERAIRTQTGWVMPIGFGSPFVPDFNTALGSWLSAPVSIEELGIPDGPDVFLHLAWSATAGFGIGVLFRVQAWWRVVGLVPLLLVGIDHASVNYEINIQEPGGFGDAVTTPFIAAQDLLGLWPLLALVIAVALDHRTLRRQLRVHDDLSLSAEGEIGGETLAALTYAVMKPLWTSLVVQRFVSMRRSALYAADLAPTDRPTLVDDLTEMRTDMETARSPEAWRGVGIGSVTFGGPSGPLRRFWPWLLWLVLLFPTLLYYGVGASEGAAGLQEDLASRWAFLATAAVLGGGIVWLGWQIVAGLRVLPAALRQAHGAGAARVEFGLMVAVGAGVLGAVTLLSVLTGSEADDRLITNFHLLDALGDLLLVAGIALLLAAVIFFPPAAPLALAGGGFVLVPTVTGSFVALTGLGLTSIVLSQAVNNAGGDPPSGGRGGGGSGSGGGVPNKPPATEPNVRHWKLRRIVDQLYKGTSRADRIGDGTTMDAVRNELLTGRSTQGTFHSTKARESMNALRNWLRQYERTATEVDVKHARRLLGELKNILGGN